jgi:ADP-heptose:LPS heptosyltransferase
VNIPEKLAIRICLKNQCGLGDLLRKYHRKGHLIGRLKAFKEQNPETKIKLLISCHNPQGRELFKFMPWIENVEKVPWSGKAIGNIPPKIKGWSIDTPRIRTKIKQCKYEKPDIFLSKADELVVNKIRNRGPFVVLHPFAGQANRMPIPPNRYTKLVDDIVNRLKMNVVVVGGTHTRGARLRKIKPITRVEKFPYKRTGLFNLVNNTNVRIVSQLVRDSYGFMGNWSCYACIAWEEKKPAALFVRKGGRNILYSKGFKGRWHDKCLALLADDSSLYDKAMIKAVNFFKDLAEEI